jgi:hypothetical protein
MKLKFIVSMYSDFRHRARAWAYRDAIFNDIPLPLGRCIYNPDYKDYFVCPIREML